LDRVFASKRGPLPLTEVSMKFSRALLLRVATHVAVWIPFLAAVAGMLHAEWRAVGDGARIALGSWASLTGHGPLVGPGTRLGPHLHDPGPLEYWLLAVPVHLDPVRGVFWGAALWCMAAGSLAVEAMWAVLGEIGGVLAAGAILWALAWRPEIAAKPYWNPWFSTMFFLAALAAGWAVVSGRRWWWPVLVVTASVAAQAHLMFALAAAGLVLLALVVGMADASRAGTGFRWAAAGLAATIACWTAPLIQQVAGPGRGNLAALLHGQGMGPRTGLGFALKTLTASVQPPPIWWLFPQPGMNIEGRSAAFAVAILAVTAAALLAAVFSLRSRFLARIAALSVLASAAVLVTFARIPLGSDNLIRLWYLTTVLLPVGMLAWLTIGAAFVITGRRLISQLPPLQPRTPAPCGRRPLKAARAWARPAARLAGVTAAALIVVASWLEVVPRVPSSLHDAPLVHAVSVSSQLIEQALPSQPLVLSVSGGKKHTRRRLTTALVWALTGAGYQLQPSSPPARSQQPHVMVLLDSTITVDITKPNHEHKARTGPCPARFPAEP
jgi:hypothetical protein